MSQNCANCRHFLPAHQCRRHAPVVGGVTTENPWGEWPRVSEGDWCGDFEPKAAPPTPAPSEPPLDDMLAEFLRRHVPNFGFASVQEVREAIARWKDKNAGGKP